MRFGILVVLLSLVGCTRVSGGGNSSSGSLALSRDEQLLFAADGDFDAVLVVDPKTQALLYRVEVGRQPEKLLVAPDGTLYVTNRMGRSVSVILPGSKRESARLPVGVEPSGLAMSSDGHTLYVVNATSLEDAEYGTLMAFDTETRAMRWELPVGNEPRAVALLDDQRAGVSLSKEGELVMVDLENVRVIGGGSGTYTRLNNTALNGTLGPAMVPNASVRVRGFDGLTVSADGERIIGLARVSSAGLVAPGAFGGIAGRSGYYGAATCLGATAVSSTILLGFDGSGHTTANDVSDCSARADAAVPPLFPSSPRDVIQGGTSMLLDPTGRFLVVANRESNNVVVVAAKRLTPGDLRGLANPLGSVLGVANVGAGPSGLALTRDGKTLYVYNAFDHSVSSLDAFGPQTLLLRSTRKVINEERLSPQAVAGRKLFFDATDARMNDPGTGISCASCHLEGREDGHVWNFADGPRRTPSLQGRHLAQTAPYHWNGQFTDLATVMSDTITERMGGRGITREMGEQLVAFLDELPEVDNPNRNAPVEVQLRGRAAFEKAQCNSCHSGSSFTDNSFADVGTLVTEGNSVDDVRMLPRGALNVPSLLGIARTAPYLHDGSAQTLKARILSGKNLDRHGKTSVLSNGEVDDLVAYLKTL